jgi:hypothetical protein
MTTQAELFFGTILVARKPQTPPSEVELKLRQCSKLIKIVEKLSGGAHLLLPIRSDTIAVRVYFPHDLKQFDSQLQHDAEEDAIIASKKFKDLVASWSNGEIPKWEKGLDGVLAFRDAFKYPAIFFVLPTSQDIEANLSRPTAFSNQVQMLFNESSEKPTASNNVSPSACETLHLCILVLTTPYKGRIAESLCRPRCRFGCQDSRFSCRCLEAFSSRAQRSVLRTNEHEILSQSGSRT